MIDQLDRALSRLLRESGARAAVIWSLHSYPSEGIVLASCPLALLPTGTAWPVAADPGAQVAVHDPAGLAALIPTTLRLVLPAAPTAARSLHLGDANLYLLMVWCGPGSDELGEDLRKLIRDDISYLAAVLEESRFNRGQVERLRATVDNVEVGLVSLDPGLGQASVNRAAAKLLNLPEGKNEVSAFAAAMARLITMAVNRGEIAQMQAALQSDPLAEIDGLWRFPESPTDVRVVSFRTQQGDFDGRVWAFYDESELAQALGSSEQARARLRANTDALLDPQVLWEAVRDPSGRIIDFVYRDVNAATSEYLGLAREELVGERVLASFPAVETAGLLARYADCVETGEPVVLDDFSYDNEVLRDTRRYDLRATRAGPDLLTLTCRDVTDRYELAQQIAESEERFRLLAENVGDVVCRTDGDGKFLWVSGAVHKALGAPPEYFIGRRLREIIAPDDQANHITRLALVARGEPYLGRAKLSGADGTLHWVHLSIKPYYDAESRPDGLVSTFRVIDEEVAVERAAEQARRLQAEADARYRRLMDNSGIAMGILTPEGRFDVVNQAMCDFFGYDAEYLRNKAWQELTVTDYLEADLKKVEEMLAGSAESYRTTKQYIHASGRLMWGDLSLSCLRSPDGQVENFISQIIDTTREVLLAQRLQEQTDRLTSQLDSAARYIKSILPGPLDGEVRVSSRYLPSEGLAGDCFDYRWVDDDHLIVYLVDVSGHGTEPALVSMSVHNMLRSGSVPAATLLEPGRLLAELNNRFPMEQQGGNYFTMWYGVFELSTRTLCYSSGGHPPALLFTPAEQGVAVSELSADGLPVGMFEDCEFPCATAAMPAGSQLVLCSDGAYELPLIEGQEWSREDFIDLCTRLAGSADWSLDTLIDQLRARAKSGVFEDDVSIVQMSL